MLILVDESSTETTKVCKIKTLCPSLESGLKQGWDGWIISSNQVRPGFLQKLFCLKRTPGGTTMTDSQVTTWDKTFHCWSDRRGGQRMLQCLTPFLCIYILTLY